MTLRYLFPTFQDTMGMWFSESIHYSPERQALGSWETPKVRSAYQPERTLSSGKFREECLMAREKEGWSQEGQYQEKAKSRAQTVKWQGGGGGVGPVPTYGKVTHVSALSDQFLLLTLKIKIKCITIDQFTGIWYICFGNVKQNGVTSLCVLPELEKGISDSLGRLHPSSPF